MRQCELLGHGSSNERPGSDMIEKEKKEGRRLGKSKVRQKDVTLSTAPSVAYDF